MSAFFPNPLELVNSPPSFSNEAFSRAASSSHGGDNAVFTETKTGDFTVNTSPALGGQSLVPAILAVIAIGGVLWYLAKSKKK